MKNFFKKSSGKNNEEPKEWPGQSNTPNATSNTNTPKIEPKIGQIAQNIEQPLSPTEQFQQHLQETNRQLDEDTARIRQKLETLETCNTLRRNKENTENSIKFEKHQVKYLEEQIKECKEWLDKLKKDLAQAKAEGLKDEDTYVKNTTIQIHESTLKRYQDDRKTKLSHIIELEAELKDTEQKIVEWQRIKEAEAQIAEEQIIAKEQTIVEQKLEEQRLKEQTIVEQKEQKSEAKLKEQITPTIPISQRTQISQGIYNTVENITKNTIENTTEFAKPVEIYNITFWDTVKYKLRYNTSSVVTAVVIAGCIIVSSLSLASKFVPSLRSPSKNISPITVQDIPANSTKPRSTQENLQKKPGLNITFGMESVDKCMQSIRNIFTSSKKTKTIASKLRFENKLNNKDIVTKLSYPQETLYAETVNNLVNNIYQQSKKKIKVYANINLGVCCWIKWTGEKGEVIWMGEIGTGAPTKDTMSPVGFSRLKEKMANAPFIIVPKYVNQFKGFEGISGFYTKGADKLSGRNLGGATAYAAPWSVANLLGPTKFRLVIVTEAGKDTDVYMMTLGRSCWAPWLSIQLDGGLEKGITRQPKDSTTFGCIYIAYYRTYIYKGNEEEFLKGDFKNQLAEGKFKDAVEGMTLPLKNGEKGILKKPTFGMEGELRIYNENGEPVNVADVDWTRAPKITYLPIYPEESKIFQDLNVNDLIYTDDSPVFVQYKNGEESARERELLVLSGVYDDVRGNGINVQISRLISILKGHQIILSQETIQELVNAAIKTKGTFGRVIKPL